MRLRHPDGTDVHLAYCTNVHPAEDLPGVLRQLDTFAEPIRVRLAADELGIGLFLAAPVAAALAADRTLRLRLRHELLARGLRVVTLNGFPYQAFHAPVVKHAVYHPDWTDPRRLAYTLDLAVVLLDLLPDDAARGSISTLPYAWRTPWGPGDQFAALQQFQQLARGLAELAKANGRPVRVAIEPEPGCVVQTSEQALTHLSQLDSEYIGVCLDLAHLACAWEDPGQVVAAFGRAGIPVVKTQVSAALEVVDPVAAREALISYDEPRFLHQTRSSHGREFDDLDEALAQQADGPWRVHFHVPLHAQPSPPLAHTLPVLRSGLAAVVGGPLALTDHLEVETYTWSVLPADRRPVDDAGLVAGIAAELAFARDELLALGLTPAQVGPLIQKVA